MNKILICKCCSQIFELCHAFKGPIPYLDANFSKKRARSPELLYLISMHLVASQLQGTATQTKPQHPPPTVCPRNPEAVCSEKLIIPFVRSESCVQFLRKSHFHHTLLSELLFLKLFIYNGLFHSSFQKDAM
jgi:hypothetical protein